MHSKKRTQLTFSPVQDSNTTHLRIEESCNISHCDFCCPPTWRSTGAASIPRSPSQHRHGCRLWHMVEFLPSKRNRISRFDIINTNGNDCLNSPTAVSILHSRCKSPFPCNAENMPTRHLWHSRSLYLVFRTVDPRLTP